MKGFVVEELRCVALDPSNQRSADPGCGPLRGRENPVHDKAAARGKDGHRNERRVRLRADSLRHVCRSG